MTILVTGGAGYIGSHLVKRLLKEGHRVVAIDNLSVSKIDAICVLQKHFGKNLEFIKTDLRDDSLAEILLNKGIEVVMHLAAKANVAESVQNPALYHQVNFLGGINLIEMMLKAGVTKLTFSSTAAVYGSPQYIPIDENHPTNPQSPYGQTKLDFEKYLKKVQNLDCLIFRYFNVGGSDHEGILGKAQAGGDLLTNLMEVALGLKDNFLIFGNDYDTRDGTAIRDFIHVDDIASAHILALNNLVKYRGEIFNLGSGKGFTIKEIVDQASLIFAKEILTQLMARRPGDIGVSVASIKKAKEELGFEPQNSSLEEIIRTDWSWRKSHPKGYQI